MSAILTENSPCTDVSASLTVSVTNIPGNVAALFMLVVSTTCPGGIASGYPNMTITVNNETFGPYTSATLPASVTHSTAGVVNITGGFNNPRFAPVDNGNYNIAVRLDAVDTCGNSKFVEKHAFFSKRPPNPKAFLGSQRSGGYIEGDVAEKIGATEWTVEGSMKDYQSNALGPAANQQIRIRLFDTATGKDCPGYLLFDYSSDIDVNAGLPTGGTGSPNYGVDLAPFIVGGTGVNSASGVSGDFSFTIDKAEWADHHGFAYSLAKNLGVSLEVSVQVDGVDYWSNVATSFFPVYCLEDHICAVTATTGGTLVGGTHINLVATPSTTTHTADDWNRIGPTKWTVGRNSEEILLGGGTVVESAPDPSGITLIQIDYSEDEVDIYLSDYASSHLIQVSFETLYEHKDTGDIVKVRASWVIDFDHASGIPISLNQAYPTFITYTFFPDDCYANATSTWTLDSNVGGMGLGGILNKTAVVSYGGIIPDSLTPPLEAGVFFNADHNFVFTDVAELAVVVVLNTLAGRYFINNYWPFLIKRI